MRKLLAILMLTALLGTMVLPVLADENGNTCASVLEIPVTVKEHSVPKRFHLLEKELMEIIAQENDIIPEDADIRHLTMIRQRYVNNGNEPFDISLRSWGFSTRYLVLMYRPSSLTDEMECVYDEGSSWEILACKWGNFIDGTIPGDGTYVLAWSW